MAGRIGNVILGIWLFISAFIWAHSAPQFWNTWILGVLCVVFALVAIAVPALRYLNLLLSIWLFVSVWVLPLHTIGTGWNNAIVAILVFIFSLVPSEREQLPAPPAPREPHPA